MKSLIEELGAIGSDTEQTLERFMGNESLYEKIVKKFLDDTSYQSAADAMKAGDDEQAMGAVHTLKGVAANLGFTSVYKIADQMMTEFRQGNPKGAYDLLDKLTEEYNLLISVIKNYQNNSD